MLYSAAFIPFTPSNTHTPSILESTGIESKLLIQYEGTHPYFPFTTQFLAFEFIVFLNKFEFFIIF